MSKPEFPPASFTPTMLGYTGQGAFRYWCQTALPLVYDDSLSYYELLNKVVTYLNNVIADVSAVESNIDALHTSYSELQNYVNEHFDDLIATYNELESYVDNYFSTLDVQDEINEKLDNMAYDGSLSALLAPIIPDLVTAWMNEHITPTSPVIDNTLTISGAGADAKVTGNRLHTLEATYDTTKNLFWFTDTTPREVAPLTYDFAFNSTIRVNGTTGGALRSIIACGNPDNRGLKPGTYIVYVNKRDEGSDYTGAFQLQYNTETGGYTNFSSGEPFTISESAFLRIQFSGNKTFNVTYDFSLYDVSDENGYKIYVANKTGVDYIARNDIEITNDNINEINEDINNIEKNFETTKNLFWFTDTTPRTSGPLSYDFAFNSSIRVDGTNGGNVRSVIACGNPDNRGIKPGTYIVLINKRDVGSDYTGGFALQCNTPANGYQSISSGVPFTITENAFLRVQFSASKTFNVTYDFSLYDVSVNNDYTSYVANKTGVDYVARDAISKKYTLSVPVFNGALDSVTGSETNGYQNYNLYRKTDLISVKEDSFIMQIPFYERVSYFNAYEYNSTNGVSYEGVVRNLSASYETKYTRSNDNVAFVKFVFVLTEHFTDKLDDIIINTSYAEIKKSPDLRRDNLIKMAYNVSNEYYTSGNLLLPPNYTIDGKSVPLIVVLHGTSSMNTWDEVIGHNSGVSTRYLIDYLCNEGFAVFDCYPFTSKYYKTTQQINSAPLPANKKAYIEGIKYVCNHYNVDINNVCMYSMSLGGNMGYWFMNQNEINIRAIAMLSPTTGWLSLIFSEYFLQESGRYFVLESLGLLDEPNADTFISTDDGTENSVCVQFVEDHLNDFAGLNWIFYNTHGCTFSDQYNWQKTPTTEMPTWMNELNIPMWAGGWVRSGVPSVINHPELSKYTSVPVKYWQAFDDTNTSPHTTFTVYQWLKNGGSNVKWRTLPNGTGAHHAVDTDENALKQSGTTKLGISYTDIATAYVEMAEFFWDNIL